MEYCPYGNLKTFLRERRDIYDVMETSLKSDLSQTFGSKNIILFAFQVAKGMEFLTSRKVGSITGSNDHE